MYTIYNKDFAPEALLSRYPKAATYEDETVYVFGDSLESLTGVAADNISDLAALGFNHPYSDDGAGLIAAELDALVNQLQAGEPTGVEVQLSNAQGKYLYKTRFDKEGE